jgi:hypothetical protein
MSEERSTHAVADGIQVPDDLVPAEVELVGVDGNAGSIMAAITRPLKRKGNPTWMIELFREQCMEGDYDHLIRCAMAYNGTLD